MTAFLIGWDGRTRTSEMAGPKPAALPLGDVPMEVYFHDNMRKRICQYYFFTSFKTDTIA